MHTFSYAPCARPFVSCPGHTCSQLALMEYDVPQEMRKASPNGLYHDACDLACFHKPLGLMGQSVLGTATLIRLNKQDGQLSSYAC